MLADYAKLSAMFQSGNVTVIDVRPPGVFEAKPSVPGAINLPWGRMKRRELFNLPADKNTNIVCFGPGDKGKAAADILKDQDGYVNVGFASSIPQIKALVRGDTSDPVLRARPMMFKKDVVIVDLRPPAKAAEDPVPGAINIPYPAKFANRERANLLPADKTATIVCFGRRAGEAAARMLREQDGYENAFFLMNGKQVQTALARAAGAPAPAAVAAPGNTGPQPRKLGGAEGEVVVVPKNAVVVDLRPAARAAAQPVPAATVNVPWPEFAKRGELGVLPADKDAPIVCFGAGKAKAVAQALMQDGYKNVAFAPGLGRPAARGASANAKPARPLALARAPAVTAADVVVDLRAPAIVAAKPIPGAVVIPWAAFQERATRGLPSDKAAKIVCVGAKAQAAAELLQLEDGYTNAAAVSPPGRGNKPGAKKARPGAPAIPAADVVIDLRMAARTAAAPIPDAIVIPWGQFKNRKSHGLPSDKNTKIVCVGGKAEAAVEVLENEDGYLHVTAVVPEKRAHPKAGPSGAVGQLNADMARACAV